MTKKICKKLRKLSDDEDAKRLFEWFANAGQHRDKTTVDRLEEQTGVGRRKVITFLKELESIGVGKFVVGRHSQLSRIVLQYERSEVGDAGLGVIRNIEPRYYDEDDELESEKKEVFIEAMRQATALGLGIKVSRVTIKCGF